MKKFFALAILVLSLMACTDDGKYELQDDVVVYSYWTFSFGPVNDTLPGADPATFETVNSWLGHDSERVYFKDKIVPGADVASLEPQRYPLFRDKNDYYYEENAMHVADVSSFKILKRFDRDFWAVDSRNAYFDTLRIDGVDLPSFKVMSFTVARDKNRVYFFGKVIPGADPATFQEIGHSAYYRDKSHVWCGNELLEDADLATFQIDDYDRAHDKYGAFRMEKRDTVTVQE